MTAAVRQLCRHAQKAQWATLARDPVTHEGAERAVAASRGRGSGRHARPEAHAVLVEVRRRLVVAGADHVGQVRSKGLDLRWERRRKGSWGPATIINCQ